MNKILTSSLLILLSAALLFSCKKDISNIGVEVVGENPLEVIFMDTITISTHSELIDSLRADELSAHVLGAYKDVVFGTLNASVYSQFNILTDYEESPFGSNAVLDSIFLYIHYADKELYGDTNSYMNLTVYELGDDLERDSIYYSFQNTRTKSDILGSLSFIPSFDSIDYYTKPTNPEDTPIDTLRKLQPITIPLSEEFGEWLLQDTSIYNTRDGFLDAFKGLYITTLDDDLPTEKGNTVNTTFNSTETYIALYYHNDSTFYEDDDGNRVDYNRVFKYRTDISTAHYSNFNHYDYADADADFRNQVIEGDTTLGNQKFYMQGLAGVRTTIEFPHMRMIDDYYNYAVNEAKLFVYDINDNADNANLSSIPSLTLSHQIDINDDVDYYLVSDASSGEKYFNGQLNTDDRNYYFRITQYMQDLIEGNTYDNKLRLEVVGGAVKPHRLIAAGSEAVEEEKKMVLQIIYTKIDDDE